MANCTAMKLALTFNEAQHAQLMAFVAYSYCMCAHACVCMCVCVFVYCVFSCVCIYMYRWQYTHTHTHIHTYIGGNGQRHSSTVNTHVQRSTPCTAYGICDTFMSHVCARVCARLCTCVCVCFRGCLCTYI